MTSSSSTNGPRQTRTLVVLIGAAVLAFAGFIALGTWQVKRLAWKEALIARVQAHVQGEPVAAPGPQQWSGLTVEAHEYRRIAVAGQFDYTHEVLVQATTELGSGFWVLTPLRTEQGFWLYVNRGFVPPELRAPSQLAAFNKPGTQHVVGLLRFTEPGGGFLRHNDPAQGRWYSRDIAAISQAQGLSSASVAPYFVDAVAHAGDNLNAWPRPGLTVLRFSNNHLVYALTWFALAAMTAGALGYLIVDERRLRRLALERQEHAPHA